ncbi:MAG: hypothetical protein QM758_03875 [Armatimonas sp.]
MTEVQAQRLVCEAALLDDTRAAAKLLGQALDALTEQDEVMATLLLAYAWVDPEDALRRCQQPAWAGRTRQPSWLYDDWVPTIPFWIEQIREAHSLYRLDTEEKTAYAAMTELLPRSLPQYSQRRGALKLACALDSPEKFLAVRNWETYVIRNDGLSVFLAAELWKVCPYQLWEKLQDLPRFAPRLLPIGQWVLSARYKPENLPLLIAITHIQCEKHGGTYSGTELSAVFKSLEVLEAHAPQELRKIVPAVLKIISAGNGARDSVLTAYALVLVSRLNLDGYELIRPLVSRIRGRKGISESRRWARQIQHQVKRYEPVLPQVTELVYLLRVMALERRLDGILIRAAPDKTAAQIYRAWRWLLRSDRVIASVADKGWREYLYKRKVLLESKVPHSRKARHINVYISEAK